jgi:chromosome segregation ATPase
LDQAERFEKQKKQNAALEHKMQELKKAASVYDTEIRELRLKLRTAEQERKQFSTKHNEAAESRKMLSSLESRHRTDMQGRDRRISELEKAMGEDIKKRTIQEQQLTERQMEIDDLRAENAALQTQVSKWLC